MGEVPALRIALQDLVDDPIRRKRLGSAGLARARSLADPAVQIDRLERVLAACVEEAVA
jgi:hypothetical protein